MLNSAVILAGGKSSRMGQDKALLPFGSKDTLSEFQYSRLKELFKNVYISTKYNKFNFNADLILDKSSYFSPMVALESILDSLDEDFFLISVDMPLFSKEAIKALIDAYNQDSSFDIYLYKSQNYLEPTAAIYSKNIKKRVKELLKIDIHKLQFLTKNSNIKILPPIDEINFLNVNKKEDYELAKEYLIKFYQYYKM